MNGFFQLLIAWGVLLVFVLLLYMIDKFNFVFSSFSQAETPQTYTDGLFGELYGKPLWDAMSGLPIPGIDKKLVENLKPHYEPALRQHIEQVFMEGYHHAREGTLGVPSNNRMIPTPRGALESWLPLHHLSSIYQAGSEFYSKPDSDVLRIQQSLDQITSMLYARVGISLLDPYSRTLMVHPIGVERPFAQQSQALSTESSQPVVSAPTTGVTQAFAASNSDDSTLNGVGSNAVTNESVATHEELTTSSVSSEVAASGALATSAPSPSGLVSEPISGDNVLLQPNLNAIGAAQSERVMETAQPAV